jgi:hypothetical protein
MPTTMASTPTRTAAMTSAARPGLIRIFQG